MTDQMPPPAARRSTRVTSIIVIVVVFAAIAFAVSQCSKMIAGLGDGAKDALACFNGEYVKQERFQAVMKMLNEDSRVTAALGAPVEHVSLYNCNFNFDSGQITVSYGINLKGPAAIGTADIALNESGGKRSFTQATFKDAAGKRTDLLAGGGI